MGYAAAADFAEHADLRIALVWHLTSNHYPPLPESLVEPCVRAIELARDGEWDEHVDLSETGMKVRTAVGDFTDQPTASRLVDICHLEAFVETYDGDAMNEEEF